jgi:hypothetical protein
MKKIFANFKVARPEPVMTDEEMNDEWRYRGADVFFF